MRRFITGMLPMLLCLYAPAPALAGSDPNDQPGSTDPALFSRMPGFYIQVYEVLEFGRYEFKTRPDATQAVEGRSTLVVYCANEGITHPSGLQITRNYVGAAEAIGGSRVHEFEDGGTEYVVIRVVKNDMEVWTEVSGANNGMYNVRMIEKQLMKQVVVANAEALSGSIAESGRVVVYGIYFDTNKAELKPESEPALAAIVKMLQTDAALKLFVVGHTDNVGQFAHNLELSQDRAASVVNALVGKHGIAAARLIPFGAGPVAPVGANTTDEGKAKNRRVELVAQ